MFETVEDLTSAVTSVLSPDGPLGTLALAVTDALDSVWAEFFGAPTPPGGTNWNAYTHEQLYRMLWEDADVGEVSTVAAEWGRHSTALTGYADALRREADGLRANWQGQAADLAADRLAELSDRIWNAGARAGTVQKAAADAGDALAVARNTMPPPPPDPMTLATSAVGAGPLHPIQAILVGGARIFTADAVAGASKAEAVRVMQQYESSLHNSSRQVVPTRPGATTSRQYAVDGKKGAAQDGGATTSAASLSAGGLSAGGGTGGVPWSRLVGGATPGPGGLVGGGPPPVQGVLAAESAALSEAAKRAMGPGGFFAPASAARPGDEEHDKRHETRLPNVDNGLFAVDERTSAPVIGAVTERENDIGFQ
ncbi:WXG100 family type VII secretion target [Actinophytocola sp. KF-1]